VVLISQATAREVFGTDSPLGAQMRMGSAEQGPWRTIVGVVGDVHHADVTAPVTAAMYVPEEQFTDSFLVAVVKSAAADPSSLCVTVWKSEQTSPAQATSDQVAALSPSASPSAELTPSASESAWEVLDTVTQLSQASPGPSASVSS